MLVKAVEQETQPASVIAAFDADAALQQIATLNDEVESRYADQMVVNNQLSRSLVSFQANKGRAVYRWFKYKEAFSAGLVEHLLQKCRVTDGILLDPFAGIGTTLFAASEMGIPSEGIELLPIGQRVIATKQEIDSGLKLDELQRLEQWQRESPWREVALGPALNELRITRGAFPPETVASIRQYLTAICTENPRVRTILLFALLCVLERVSFTRKDGQYLRWDHRSGRRSGKKQFDKGRILPFDEAIIEKLSEINHDLRPASRSLDLFPAEKTEAANIQLHSGSCLDILPTLPSGRFSSVMTSPPYCNRYDYTRTYALELAMLGVDEAGLLKLRQEMLSCTVENRAKDLLSMNPAWQPAISVADEHRLLQAILRYLDNLRTANLLNNTGIPRMVRGYFYEMACVIAECGRVLKPGAPLIMVNDNVRYAGASISVDCILSDFADQLGFHVESILVLPNGKGNSSQQMGAHGRESLRKCVYVWRKR